MSKMIRLRNFGSKDVLKAEDVEISQPDAGEVLVSIHAASVNPVDFKIRSGKYPAVRDDRLPYTLGRDFSGIVAKCGAQAKRFKVGDEVFGMVGIHGGGYAEQAVVDQDAIAAKPPDLITSTRPRFPWPDRRLGRDCSGTAACDRVNRC